MRVLCSFIQTCDHETVLDSRRGGHGEQPAQDVGDGVEALHGEAELRVVDATDRSERPSSRSFVTSDCLRCCLGETSSVKQ